MPTPPHRRHLRLVADPLPECNLCETPTRRAAWEANGGVCTACADGLVALADRVTRGAVQLRPLYPEDS